jgi:hypothetical protein
MDAATTATGQVADIRDTEQGRAERGGLTGRIQMERERDGGHRTGPGSKRRVEVDAWSREKIDGVVRPVGPA